MADTEKSVKIEEGDPQSVQDLTGFVPFNIQHVQTLLQQMQDKFQQMSDQIITRTYMTCTDDCEELQKLTLYMYSKKHSGRVDDMSTRIDDLEKNIGDLMNQAGVDEPEK